MAPKETAAANQNAVTITSQPRATAVPIHRHCCPLALPSSTDFGRAPENTVPLLLPRRPGSAPLCRRPAPAAPGPSALWNLPGVSGARPWPRGGTNRPSPGPRGPLPTEGRRPGQRRRAAPTPVAAPSPAHCHADPVAACRQVASQPAGSRQPSRSQSHIHEEGEIQRYAPRGPRITSFCVFSSFPLSLPLF